MRKIIFFDVDGTLITEDGRSFIPESTKKAIAKARENGNLTFINTGRTAFNLSSKIKSLGFDGYLCGCGTYIEYQNKVILYNKLDSNFCRKIADIVRECKASPVYERIDGIFFDDDAEPASGIDYYKNYFLESGICIDNRVSDLNFSFDKFVVWRNKDTDMKRFVSEIEKDFTIIDRGDDFFEMVPVGFSKATAIDLILKELNIKIEDAYAIGDSTNDLPMLTAVPNSIAMGGASTIYPYVSYITKPICEDGIEYALRHFNII